MSILGGVEEFLQYLKDANRIISLCSNRDKNTLDLILANKNLTKYFDNIISCADAGHQKPDPYCLVKLIEKYPHVTNRETIYIGDSKTDETFANNAGMEYLIIDQYLNSNKFYSIILSIFQA